MPPIKDAARVLSITLPYMGFELTDGAIRMMIVLTFHEMGYSAFQIAGLFLLYEIAGIVTNFVGGWLGSNLGLEKILVAGLALQVVAMGMLTVGQSWLTVPYVMITQGLSGMAKDLVKVSSKSSLKFIIPDKSDSALFKWVSIITGSKNALKGVGFFLGGVLMVVTSMQVAMAIMAVCLAVGIFFTLPALPKNLGRSHKPLDIRSQFKKTKAIHVLSGARFFLFGSRDVWFVIGLPVFLQEVLGWSYTFTAGFMGAWIIGYGMSQTAVSRFFDGGRLAISMGHESVAFWTASLILFPTLIILALSVGFDPGFVLMVGLMGYGVFFAVNSIIHSFLVLVYSDHKKASADVGFYYMANAGGRLAGTLLSGWVYQTQGFVGCLIWSCAFLIAASLVSLLLPPIPTERLETVMGAHPA
ncbi:organoarsenical effux MFS transporter ArsJ [Hyalangium sp.]|uniref:organoarsenical effux MFS transporter ArsJ n=1 Tax=Hyalangium sp. TaxID=2028555 RepID=UPI002D33A962|nr:organoarsenical effux MFS transporter ArsJ [Hyalangium sp.]HYI00970.1 organoarsenical effux MFS transporter ArsJ [Hyalangium sp.]